MTLSGSSPSAVDTAWVGCSLLFSFLGARLTGIVTTTDNGGSTGRLRRARSASPGAISRNCLNQLVTEPSIGSRLFEYRFTGRGELAGHDLGNLMLLALDNLCVRSPGCHPAHQ